MRKYLSVLILFLIAGAVLAGCATLFKGSNEKVSLASDPSQAKVYVNGEYMGETPVQLPLQSKHTYSIEFRKDGYQSKTVLLNDHVGAGWIVLDVIGGLVPVIIDAATGDWYYLDQTHVNAALEKQQ